MGSTGGMVVGTGFRDSNRNEANVSSKRQGAKALKSISNNSKHNKL